jgi:hypothetical protein
MGATLRSLGPILFFYKKVIRRFGFLLMISKCYGGEHGIRIGNFFNLTLDHNASQSKTLELNTNRQLRHLKHRKS